MLRYAAMPHPRAPRTANWQSPSRLRGAAGRIRNDYQWNAQTANQRFKVHPRSQAGVASGARSANHDEIKVRFPAGFDQTGFKPTVLRAGAVLNPAQSGLAADAAEMCQNLLFDRRFHIVAECVLCARVDAPAIAGNALPELRHNDEMMQPPALGYRVQGRELRCPASHGVMAGQQHIARQQRCVALASGAWQRRGPMLDLHAHSPTRARSWA